MGKKRLTTEDFIRISIKRHGDLYDYSFAEYTGSLTKVKIVCQEHGIFEQRPSTHMIGQGCPNCAIEKSLENRKVSKDDLVLRIKNKHYNSIKFVEEQEMLGVDKKYKFIHSCGHEWYATANSILNGSGCPKCAQTGFKTDKPAVFYILKVNGDSEFTGFGISNKYKTRKSTHKKNLKVNNCSIVSEILIHSNGSSIQNLESYIKKTLQCRNSSIEGFRTESVLISPEELKIFCENYLQSLGVSYTLSVNT